MNSSTQTSERSFGLTVGSVCIFLALFALWRGREGAAIAWEAVGFTLILPALIAPRLLRIPCALWWRLAHVLGWVNSRILLSVIFFGLFMPLAMILRMVGWDPMRRRGQRGGTAWFAYPQRVRNPHHYERMY